MKLTTKFKLIALSLSFSSSPLLAAEHILMRCQGEHDFINAEVSDSGWGHIVYNYSNADIRCSSQLDYRISHQEPFKCAGMWSFDHNPGHPDLPQDTIAVLSVKPTETAGEWYGMFVTAKDYGEKKIITRCKITDGENSGGEN